MYRLSNYLQLLKEVDSNKNTQYYTIVTKQKSKFFLINEAIYLFLECFQEPNTLRNVNTIFSKQLKIDKDSKDFKKLKTQLKDFFEKLKNKKWIVKKNAEEKEYSFETLFKEGDSFLDFKIKTVLANNKITDVYIVTNIKTKKNVVVKLLNRNKFSGKESFERAKKHLKKEYDFCERFNSIYINKTKGYLNLDDQPIMLLNLIKGESIRRFVNKNILYKDQKYKLVLKILKGFSIIHQEGVYHGDIHLSNVLVTKNYQPKIIDFGYSNNVKTKTEIVKEKPRNGGVFAFIPPERALRSIDHRFTEVVQFQSEVYQIGLIIYYVYLKNIPFKAITWKTMVDEKKEFDINNFEPFLKKRMPKQVRRFIIKCLAANPKQRYIDAKDMHYNWKTLFK